jgi:putative membrane protein
MYNFKHLSLLALAAFSLCLISVVQASERTDAISAEDFTEEASAKGIAEIEVAKLALDKATNQEVRGFAQTMIDDHRRANLELSELAARKDLDVSDDAELINQAKALVLRLRDEESFDRAYMNNQMLAHQETIELFRRASESSDEDIAAFARKTLPKLEHHLQMAEEISAQLLNE